MHSKEYTGSARIFLPTARTGISAGEELKLKAILLGAKAKHAAVYYRPMGAGKFSKKTLGHLGRGSVLCCSAGACSRLGYRILCADYDFEDKP
jgi:hypothetical protein